MRANTIIARSIAFDRSFVCDRSPPVNDTDTRRPTIRMSFERAIVPKSSFLVGHRRMSRGSGRFDMLSSDVTRSKGRHTVVAAARFTRERRHRAAPDGLSIGHKKLPIRFDFGDRCSAQELHRRAFMKPTSLGSFVFSAALVAFPSHGLAQDLPEPAPVERADGLETPEGATVQLDCAIDHQGLFDGRMPQARYFRLLVVDLRGPVLALDEIQDEAIVGFHEADDSFWVELANGSARRLASARTESPLATPAAASPTPTLGPARGRIVSVYEDQVTVDIGRRAGLEIGHSVDLSARSAEDWDASESAVIGVVDAVEDERARVRLRWGESVAADSAAIPTSSAS